MKPGAVVIALVLATAGCGSATSPSPGPDGSPVPVTPPAATEPATRGGATDSPPTGGAPAATVTPAATGTALMPSPSETPSFPIPSSVDRDFADSDEMRRQRDELVDTYVAPRVTDARVLAAMRAVPRHSFVPTEWLGDAYADHPLPNLYHRMLVWDIVSRPWLTRTAEQLLNPVIGKSLVVYLRKPERVRAAA